MHETQAPHEVSTSATDTAAVAVTERDAAAVAGMDGVGRAARLMAALATTHHGASGVGELRALAMRACNQAGDEMQPP